MNKTKLPASCVILAGGQSRRMKKDKQQLFLNDEWIMLSLIKQLDQWFDEVIIVSNEPNLYKNLPVQVIQDQPQFKGFGPLAGIETSFHATKHDVLFVTACDMPLLNNQSIRLQYERLLSTNAQACLLQSAQADMDIYPFHAFYHRSILPLLNDALKKCELKLRWFVKQLSLSFVNFDALSMHLTLDEFMMNLNTPEDLAKYENYLKGDVCYD